MRTPSEYPELEILTVYIVSKSEPGIQCVWLWGIGQEIINFEKLIATLQAKSEVYRKMTEEEKKTFHLRLKAPYPLDTVKST